MVNENFGRLPGNYLFTETARRAADWSVRHPGQRLLRLGIGDASLPIADEAAAAMAHASAELATTEGFRGYGPEEGYDFLRSAIARRAYGSREIEIDPEEIFVSDGAKSDCGGILDLFDRRCVTALCDPVYPAYVDALAIAGRAGEYHKSTGRWDGLVYLPCTEGNGFIPEPPKSRADVVYLCFPNNPTGAAATRSQLADWVRWANDSGAVILFDGAYEAFIRDESVPHSIYEIDGAKTCAIEIRSFSKSAGFTGVRCGYTVIPNDLKRDGVRLNALWRRRQAARFNGVSYPVQRGAEAVCTEAGYRRTKMCIEHYQQNADAIRRGLLDAGLRVFGGADAPYIWVKTPAGMNSWTFFDLLLEQCGVVTTPGAGFGPCGEGYLRLTAFGSSGDVREAVERIKNLLS